MHFCSHGECAHITMQSSEACGGALTLVGAPAQPFEARARGPHATQGLLLQLCEGRLLTRARLPAAGWLCASLMHLAVQAVASILQIMLALLVSSGCVCHAGFWLHRDCGRPCGLAAAGGQRGRLLRLPRHWGRGCTGDTYAGHLQQQLAVYIVCGSIPVGRHCADPLGACDQSPGSERHPPSCRCQATTAWTTARQSVSGASVGALR